MACIVVSNSDVRLQFIRVDSFRLILKGSFDKVMQGLFPNARDSFNTNCSATLDSSGNPRLVAFVSVALALYLATYQRLINFNYADKGLGLQKAHSPSPGGYDGRDTKPSCKKLRGSASFD